MTSKTELDFGAIVQRDVKTAATWFTGPASGPADAYRDRRALIEASRKARLEIERLRNDIQELTCGDPRLVSSPVEPTEHRRTSEQLADKHATFLRRYLLRIGCEVARTPDEIGIFDTILFLESLP